MRGKRNKCDCCYYFLLLPVVVGDGVVALVFVGGGGVERIQKREWNPTEILNVAGTAHTIPARIPVKNLQL